ncbi:MAG: diaminopimelate dehydrogenase [Firmicutes bacterium]|mgnify:CR=1 FL=1|nr:diaminopimelate dehydrogenase [Bacillota bacterium]
MGNKKLRVAIQGYGNIGRYALQAVQVAPDLELAGVVRRTTSLHADLPVELRSVAVVDQIGQLGNVDVALLCTPSRSVPQLAEEILAQGINTVDSFDIHGEPLLEHRSNLRKIAQQGESVAVVAAGWDPGTDSMVRALMELMTPQGLTFTNFGPGMSMGHTTVVKALPGVEDALSMTIPKGSGLHRRLVYVQLEAGTDFTEVEQSIKADPYFVRDETHVYQVESVQNLQDVGHGVLLERKGVSGQTANQNFRWEMRINNPALTAQIMVAAARASVKQQPGAYTLLEIPLVDYFFGDSDGLIRRLV